MGTARERRQTTSINRAQAIRYLVEIQNRTMELAFENDDLAHELGVIVGLANRAVRALNGGRDLGAMRHITPEGNA